MKRTSIASIAVAGALALPASALAQSAGDNQYQDPLANPNSGSQQRSTPAPRSAPAPSQGSSAGTSSGSAGTSTAPAAPSTTAAPASGLPRTGSDPAPLALVGVALLGGGLALRRLARAGA